VLEEHRGTYVGVGAKAAGAGADGCGGAVGGAVQPRIRRLLREQGQEGALNADDLGPGGARAYSSALASSNSRRMVVAAAPRGAVVPEGLAAAAAAASVAGQKGYPRPAVAMMSILGPLQQWKIQGVNTALVGPSTVRPAAPIGAGHYIGGAICGVGHRQRHSIGSFERQPQQGVIARGFGPVRAQMQVPGMGGTLRRLERFRRAAGARGGAGGRRGRLVGMGVGAVAVLSGYAAASWC
jgi:hypothetical protein